MTGTRFKDAAIAAAGLLLLAVLIGLSVRPFLAGKPETGGPRPDVIEGADGWLYPGWEYLLEEREDAAKQSARRIEAMAGSLRRQGIRAVILIVPSKQRIASEHLPEERRKIVEGSGAYGDFVEDLRKRGLAVADARPVLAELKKRRQAPFPPHSAHWTGEAAEAVASQVAAMIRKAGGVVNGKEQGEAMTDWTQERQFADLTAILRRQGDLRYGEDEFRFRRFSPSPHSYAPVEAIGNSFIGRQYGFPQRLSHSLGVPVRDRVVYADVGPWQAMEQFLKSKSEPEGRPRLIVWALLEESLTATPDKAR